MQQTGGFFGRLKSATAPFPSGYPAHIRTALIDLQYRRLHELTPFLCLAIAANTIAMAVAVMGDLPLWQQIAPPALIIGATLTYLLRWRRDATSVETEHAYARLRQSVPVAAAVGLVAGLWGVNAFVETERYYCTVAPVFIGLSALVAANGLSGVPRAGAAAMIGALGPLVIKMALFPNLGIRAMALMLVLIGVLQARLALGKFVETVRLLVLQAEVVELAEADPLTGLRNRRAFTAALEAAIENDRPVALAMIDLDGFKAANDTWGHAAGDAVLAEAARRMAGVAVSAGCIARLGGDEFALMFSGTAASRAEEEAEAVRSILGQPYVIDDALILVSASIGVASGDRSAAALMRAADSALYRDKRGRASQRKVLAQA